MTVLLEAWNYARDLDANPWDFATEIAALRRLKLQNSDLRWLVGRGWVEHGIEVTLGGDAQRSFQHPVRLTFSRRTCFVLSPAGAELAEGLHRGAEPPSLAESHAHSEPLPLAIASPAGSRPPKWDRDRRELRIGPVLVKRFQIPAANEETILAAFEELGWARPLDDPLPPDDPRSARCRLQQTIEALNQRQKQPLIRFLTDGAGRSVTWEFCDHRAST